MQINKIHEIDALDGPKKIKKETVDCVMTSPPYWALRDYGISGQLGLEETFEEYITKLCDIFDEVKRVLKPSGTCWVNLGDTYGGTGQKNDYIAPKYKKNPDTSFKRPNGKILEKSLVMIPFRFAIEMVNRGWILRNTIIWQKPNAMPSSVKDRFTVDFEYLFFFTKEKKYYFEQQLEEFNQDSDIEYRHALRRKKAEGYNMKKPYENNFPKKFNLDGKNKRAVWNIATKPFPEAHFAVYPEELCETPILAGCPKNGLVLDPFMGSGTTGVVALKHDRKFIGFELNKEYIEIANKRIKPYLEQTKLGIQ